MSLLALEFPPSTNWLWKLYHIHVHMALYLFSLHIGHPTEAVSCSSFSRHKQLHIPCLSCFLCCGGGVVTWSMRAWFYNGLQGNTRTERDDMRENMHNTFYLFSNDGAVVVCIYARSMTRSRSKETLIFTGTSGFTLSPNLLFSVAVSS